MKKLISITLALAMIFAMSATVFAVDSNPKENRGDYIDVDVAVTIGLLFVVGNIDSEGSLWNERTTISSVVDLYDIDDSIIAYSMELITDDQPTGYITLSAWSGTDLIQEYSFSDMPIYKLQEKEYDDSMPVYYGGPLCYALDINNLQQSFSDDYYTEEKVNNNKEFLDFISLKGPYDYAQTTVTSVNGYGEYITDPVSYLINVYGSGTCSLNSSRTLASSSDQYIRRYNGCTITAIAGVVYTNATNIIGYNASFNTINDDCEDIADGQNPTSTVYYNTSGIGVTLIDDYANDVLDYYGSSWSASNHYTSAWSGCKSEIDSGRATCLNIAIAGPYYNHSVEACGYKIYSFSLLAGPVNFLGVKDGYIVKVGTTNYGTAMRYIAMNATSVNCYTKLCP